MLANLQSMVSNFMAMTADVCTSIRQSNEGAGEARLRSSQTRSLLLKMLRGKSPCLWAESVSGRPQGPGHGTGGEASCGALVPAWASCSSKGMP